MTGLVVVNYNDYKNTINFVKSISDFKTIGHVVIVDNCSTDGSFNKLKKICDNKVSLIKNVSNKGYGSGINLGSKYLISNYGVDNIIVSNTDIIVKDNNDISIMLNYLKDDVALVGPTVLENGNLNRGWRIPSVWVDSLLNIPYFHKFIRKKMIFYRNSYYDNNYSIVDAVSGCFFIIKSDALEKVDFFDENMFLYYEENVMGIKLKNAGYTSLIINDVSVIHNHSVTIDNSMNRIRKYKTLKKSQRYFHKYYSNSSFIGMLFLDVTYLFMLCLLYILVFLKKNKKNS